MPFWGEVAPARAKREGGKETDLIRMTAMKRKRALTSPKGQKRGKALSPSTLTNDLSRKKGATDGQWGGGKENGLSFIVQKIS